MTLEVRVKFSVLKGTLVSGETMRFSIRSLLCAAFFMTESVSGNFFGATPSIRRQKVFREDCQMKCEGQHLWPYENVGDENQLYEFARLLHLAECEDNGFVSTAESRQHGSAQLP